MNKLDQFIDWTDGLPFLLGFGAFLGALALVGAALVGIVMACVVFWPLAVVLAVGVGWLAVDRSLRHRIERTKAALAASQAREERNHDAAIHALELEVLDRPLSDVIQEAESALEPPPPPKPLMNDIPPEPVVKPRAGRMLTPEQILQEQADAFCANRSREVREALRCFDTLPKAVTPHSVWECPCHGDRWYAQYGWQKPYYDFFRESRDMVYIRSTWEVTHRNWGERTIEWRRLARGEYP